MPIYKVKGAKKDGLQKYNVRANYISHIDGKPKQMTRTAYGLDAARDLERKLLSEVNDISERPTGKMTIDQLFQEYRAVQKNEVREVTLFKNFQNYKLYIKPTMADIRLDKLTVSQLQKWKESVIEKNLAYTSRKCAYKVFAALLNFAVKMDYLHRNPLSKVGNFKDNAEFKKDITYYTKDDFV